MNKNMLVLIISVITIILASCTASQSEAEMFYLEGTLNQITGISEATLLQPDETDEFWAVTEKMTQALGEDAEWYTEFRKENKYYPYVYDEKLGITEEEYTDLFINGKYIIINEAEPQAFSCETYDDNSYSMYFPAIDLSFSINEEQNNISLVDGTNLSFAKSVALDDSENLLGDWVGSTYTYLDVKSNQTGKELYALGIHDEVFDIGHENYIAAMQAAMAGELECSFVSLTIGKYKGLDEYIIYYRHIDTVEGISDYYIFKLS